MAANYQTLQVGKPKAGAVTWLSTTTANVKSDGSGTICYLLLQQTLLMEAI